MGELLEQLIIPRFTSSNDPADSSQAIGLAALDDGATVSIRQGEKIVVTTDSHVVKPVFFPGGDIGRLAAAGTVNDLVMMGARPIGLTLAAHLTSTSGLKMTRRPDSMCSAVPVTTGSDTIGRTTSSIGKRSLGFNLCTQTEP